MNVTRGLTVLQIISVRAIDDREEGALKLNNKVDIDTIGLDKVRTETLDNNRFQFVQKRNWVNQRNEKFCPNYLFLFSYSETFTER